MNESDRTFENSYSRKFLHEPHPKNCEHLSEPAFPQRKCRFRCKIEIFERGFEETFSKVLPILLVGKRIHINHCASGTGSASGGWDLAETAMGFDADLFGPDILFFGRSTGLGGCDALAISGTGEIRAVLKPN